MIGWTAWLYVRLAYRWVKDNALWLLLICLGAGAGAKLLRRKDSQVASLKDALQVQHAKGEITKLRERRDDIISPEAASVVRDKRLLDLVKEANLSINERKRRILALHNKRIDPELLSDAEVEKVFSDAGL